MKKIHLLLSGFLVSMTLSPPSGHAMWQPGADDTLDDEALTAFVASTTLPGHDSLPQDVLTSEEAQILEALHLSETLAATAPLEASTAPAGDLGARLSDEDLAKLLADGTLGTPQTTGAASEGAAVTAPLAEDPTARLGDEAFAELLARGSLTDVNFSTTAEYLASRTAAGIQDYAAPYAATDHTGAVLNLFRRPTRGNGTCGVYSLLKTYYTDEARELAAGALRIADSEENPRLRAYFGDGNVETFIRATILLENDLDLGLEHRDMLQIADIQGRHTEILSPLEAVAEAFGKNLEVYTPVAPGSFDLRLMRRYSASAPQDTARLFHGGVHFEYLLENSAL